MVVESSEYHGHRPPFYETNLFWGAVGVFAALYLTGFGFGYSGATAISGYFLIAASPFSALAIWCSLLNVRRLAIRYPLFLVLTATCGVCLWMSDRWLETEWERTLKVSLIMPRAVASAPNLPHSPPYTPIPPPKHPPKESKNDKSPSLKEAGLRLAVDIEDFANEMQATMQHYIDTRNRRTDSETEQVIRFFVYDRIRTEWAGRFYPQVKELRFRLAVQHLRDNDLDMDIHDPREISTPHAVKQVAERLRVLLDQL